jgi:hypothetical protein
VRAVVELVGGRTVAGGWERVGKVCTFAGLGRRRDALVERDVLQDGRYGCALGSLANEVCVQDPVARGEFDGLFAAWKDLFEGLVGGSGRRSSFRGTPMPPSWPRASSRPFRAATSWRRPLATSPPMAAAIDMAVTHLCLFAWVRDEVL